MTQPNIHPQEHSTARENNLVVALDLRTGRSRVVSDPSIMREMVAAVRREQERIGVRMLAGHAA